MQQTQLYFQQRPLKSIIEWNHDSEMTLTWFFKKEAIPSSSIDQFLMKLFISHWSCCWSWNWYISQWIWYNVAFFSSGANRTLLLSGRTQLQLTISFIGFHISFDTLLSAYSFLEYIHILRYLVRENNRLDSRYIRIKG